jgi:hypothetical protein
MSPPVGVALVVAPPSHCTFFVEYLFKDYWAFCSGFTQDVDHFHEYEADYNAMVQGFH